MRMKKDKDLHTKETPPSNKAATPLATMSDGPAEEDTVHITSSSPLIDKYRRDQMNTENNLTDMHLACDDGYVPIHRYLLMGLSPLLKTILLDQDPSELAVVHLVGTKVIHAVQFVTLVYFGNCVCQSNEDKNEVFKVMQSLDISTKKMQYRKSNGVENTDVQELRFFTTERKEDSGIECETVLVEVEDEAVTEDMDSQHFTNEVEESDVRKSSTAPCTPDPPSTPEPVQSPVHKKRKKRKADPVRKRKTSTAVKTTESVSTSKSKKKRLAKADRYELESYSSVGPDENEKISDSPIGLIPTIPSIDRHKLRTKLGLSPSTPLSSLSEDTILSILHQCPLCNNEFEKLKDVSKCLRYHGYRYCYACLQIIPCQGDDFSNHWISEHNICVEWNPQFDCVRKVPCPFCDKEFEFRTALPFHLGNFHGTRIPDHKDCSTVDKPQKIVHDPVVLCSIVPNSTPANNKKPRREFLYQKERDGVLHNVYCKVGHPSKTIYIPVTEDINHSNVLPTQSSPATSKLK